MPARLAPTADACWHQPRTARPSDYVLSAAANPRRRLSGAAYLMPLADPGEARFHALFLCLVGGIGVADLLQHSGRQGADLANELLQVFALHRRGDELQFLDLIEELLVLHRGVKGAAQRSEAVGRDARCREERQSDIG